MPSDEQSGEFNLHVLSQLEAFFEKDELETLVRTPRFSTEGEFSIIHDSAVLVKHATGQEAESDRFDTQIQNKICCLIELLRKVQRKK